MAHRPPRQPYGRAREIRRSRALRRPLCGLHASGVTERRWVFLRTLETRRLLEEERDGSSSISSFDPRGRRDRRPPGGRGDGEPPAPGGAALHGEGYPLALGGAPPLSRH